MFTDGNSFLKRALIFQAALRRNSYPNASTLAGEANCSTITAQRVIDRLRNDYLVPLKYDPSHKGYYLTDRNFHFELLPVDKDELASLLVMRSLAGSTGDTELQEKINSLWHRYQNSNSLIHLEIDALEGRFSCDNTELALIGELSTIEFLFLAARREFVELIYSSPWKNFETKIYRGQIEHLHYSDAKLYLLFCDEQGEERVLNCCFIKSYKLIDDLSSLTICSLQSKTSLAANWLQGFGVWTGDKLEEVSISILPPASHEYALYTWHNSQKDSWDGDVLRRSMQAVISPQLISRLLGLGRYLSSIEPEDLRIAVVKEVEALSTNLRDKDNGTSRLDVVD